jgi:hypothetical protein
MNTRRTSRQVGHASEHRSHQRFGLLRLELVEIDDTRLIAQRLERRWQRPLRIVDDRTYQEDGMTRRFVRDGGEPRERGLVDALEIIDHD